MILGDQLNPLHSWFQSTDTDVLYVLMEIRPEATYVAHHIQKIIGIFRGMRMFFDELNEMGHEVRYFKISDPDNQHSFYENLKSLIHDFGVQFLEYQEPDEYRLDELFKSRFAHLPVQVEMVSSEHFLTSRIDLKETFRDKKTFLMESFYRKMRKKFGVLMEGDLPIGGKWNYDHDNRKRLPRGHVVPVPYKYSHNVVDLYNEINRCEIDSIGSVDATQFIWPGNRKEALDVFEYFLNHLFAQFGRFQDAMSISHWSLFHSRISFALNVKMIHPLEIIKRAEEYWFEHQQQVSLAQVEGFIRQILGWREYMRGIYWAHMPGYESLNFLRHRNPLPEWYWTGDTKMNCMSKAIGQSLEYGYAHHIQRLMVTGNFALLAGVDPDEVDQWYLGIYIDAFQWVEITNTRGMSQFADGGIVGTKPYVSSASYINKMSDYCMQCHYNHKDKTGDKACPFNSMYWNFLNRHRPLLNKNPRMTMMYKVWDKMSSENREEILQKAQNVLLKIEEL